MAKMKTYYLAALQGGSNKILLTTRAESASEARRFFVENGYPLDRNSYLKVGPVTYCVATPAFEEESEA